MNKLQSEIVSMGKNDTTKKNSKEIDPEKKAELFPPRVPTSVYTIYPALSVKLRDDSPVIHDPRCYPVDGIDLSGSSYTDSAGHMTWRLSNFICPDFEPEPLIFPPSFVATPISDKPVYITVKFTPVSPPTKDMVFEVYSWRRGEPAPLVPFYWRCRIPEAPQF